MIRVFLVAFLCLFFTGCGFLDEDFFLDDEEFEESFSSGYGISGVGIYGGCGGSRVRRVGRVSMGYPSIWDYDSITEFEFEADEFEMDDLQIHAQTEQTTGSDETDESWEMYEDWHAEFLRAEKEWLQADQALARRDDKAVSN